MTIATKESLPAKSELKDDPISYAKVVILGASGVGKSAIIKRFVSNSYEIEHIPTKTRCDYYPSLVYDCSIIECRVVDLPVIDNFPTTSDDEWSRYPNFGLRNADAYILVYDVTNTDSFNFLQLLREQIAMSRGLTDVPMIVVANKTDLMPGDRQASDKFRHDIINKVKKSWKLCHVEVSAKYNWNITKVFQELSVEILSVKHRAQDCSRSQSRQTCCISCIV